MRLTKLNTGKDKRYEDSYICNYNDSNCNDSCMYDRCKWLDEATRKLAEYEEAEEQGLLVRLPVKIGDTIYVIHSLLNHRKNILDKKPELNKVHKWVVERVEVFSDTDFLIKTGFETLYSVIHSDCFDENWFLTESEALQALRERENQ